MAFRNPGVRMTPLAELGAPRESNTGDVLEVLANDEISLSVPNGDIFGNKNFLSVSALGASVFEQSPYVHIPEFGAKDGAVLESVHNDAVIKGGLNANPDNLAKVRIESENPILLTTRSDDFGQPGSPGLEFVARNNGTDPTSPDAITGGILYTRIGAGGKVELCVRFSTGAHPDQTPQVIKTAAL